MTTIDHATTTRAELIEGLANLNHAAKREMAVVGSALLPTPWDKRHASINRLLTELEAMDHADQARVR